MKLNNVKSRHLWAILATFTIGLLALQPGHAQATEPDPPIPSPEERLELAQLQQMSGLPTLNDSPPYHSEVMPSWEKLVSQSYRDGNWEIYIMNGGYSNQRRLTNHPAADIHPRLNSDVNRVVFSSNRTGAYELYTMNIDGSGLAQLSHDGANKVNPIWSPDGSKIAFEATYAEESDIYVINADGSNPTQLTSAAAHDGKPSWSPDGSQIAFVSKRSGETRLWLMQADGSEQAQIPVPGYGSHPSWSPDGTQIAYSCDDDKDGWLDACRVNPDGSDHVCLYNPVGQTDVWVNGWNAPGGKDVTTNVIVITDIAFFNYEGRWYWTKAALKSISARAYSENAYRLSSSNLDWHPDRHSAEKTPPHLWIQPLPAYSRLSGFNLKWRAYENLSWVQYSYGQSRIDDNEWTDINIEGDGGINIRYDGIYYTGNFPYPNGVNKQKISLQVAVDNCVGLLSNWKMVQTQFYSHTLSGQIYDPRDVMVNDATAIITPTAVNPLEVDAYGNFLAYMGDSSETQIQISAPGRDQYQDAEPYLDSDTQRNIWLSPQENLIANGGFEADPVQTSGWQSNEDYQPTVTTYTHQSHANAVYLGTPHTCEISPTETITESVSGLAAFAAFAVDKNNVIYAASVVDFNKIMYVQRGPDKVWSEPLLIGSIELENGDLFIDIKISLTVTPQGDIYVVWGSDYGIYYTYKLANGSWNEPEIIGYGTAGVITSDVEGNVHLIFKDYQGIHHLYKSRATQWKETYLVEEAELHSYEQATDILTARDGSIYIWGKVQYWQRTPTGQWIFRGTAPCYEIDDMAVAEDGTVHVVCNGKYSYKRPGSDWSAGEELPNYGSVGALTIDSQGVLYLATQNNKRIYFRHKTHGDAWSTPVRWELESLNYYLDLEINEQDIPHLIGSEIIIFAQYHELVCDAPTTTSSALSQTMTLPGDMLNPTLSFFYNLHGSSGLNPEAFTVRLANNLTSTIIFSSTNNTNWRHEWLDLSAWKGETITLTFASQTLAGDTYVNLNLDDISLGAYHPDLWVNIENVDIQPGQKVSYRITYGNRSGAAVDDVKIVMPTSAMLMFESAAPAPVYNTALAQQEWQLGTLPANSSRSIVITATANRNATWFSRATHTASISSPDSESSLANNTASGDLLVAYRMHLPRVTRDYWVGNW